jgi:hypothetical protein
MFSLPFKMSISAMNRHSAKCMAAVRAILQLELVDVNDQQKVLILLHACKMDEVRLCGKLI